MSERNWSNKTKKRAELMEIIGYKEGNSNRFFEDGIIHNPNPFVKQELVQLATALGIWKEIYEDSPTKAEIRKAIREELELEPKESNFRIDELDSIIDYYKDLQHPAISTVRGAHAEVYEYETPDDAPRHPSNDPVSAVKSYHAEKHDGENYNDLWGRKIAENKSHGRQIIAVINLAPTEPRNE